MKNNILQFPSKETLAKTRKEEDTFECIRSSYKDLKRATNPSKSLNLLQKQLLDLLTQLTNKTGQVVIDYPWLQEKVERTRKTIRLSLNELADFFSFEFHHVILLNNRTHYNKLIITNLSNSIIELPTSENENVSTLEQKRSDLGTETFRPQNENVPTIYIDKNTKEDLKKDSYINRSNESNFLKDSVAKEEVIPFPKTPIELKQDAKRLSAFHPLTDDEVWKINKLAGKEEYGTQFSTNYVNQLLLKLDEKKPNNSFLNKDRVFKYLAGCLRNEMRPLDKTNQQGFRFKSSDEKKEQESYLTAVENNTDTTQLSQLRRKIAGRFEDDVAFKLLKSCYFPDTLQGLKEGTYTITTNKPIELTEYQSKILLEEIKAVYEDVQNDKIIIALDIKERQIASRIAPKQEITIDKNSSWFKISERLKTYYGDAMYISWFSKLSVHQEDKEKKQLTLKAITGFIANWIKREYQDVIEHYCQLEGVDNINIIEP
jgi:hypothetical protein